MSFPDIIDKNCFQAENGIFNGVLQAPLIIGILVGKGEM
jgi:hypothetical protein